MTNIQKEMNDNERKEFVKTFCYILKKTNERLNKEEKIECECGCFITKSNLTRHRKTYKHLYKMDNRPYIEDSVAIDTPCQSEIIRQRRASLLLWHKRFVLPIKI